MAHVSHKSLAEEWYIIPTINFEENFRKWDIRFLLKARCTAEIRNDLQVVMECI
jgi:hypothetical protein